MSIIAVIDYGGSNLRSVAKAVESVAGARARVVVTDDAGTIRDAGHVVFPGQGAIGNCMARLAEHHLVEVVREVEIG
ncbi:MAG: imidazole glycerol phosphate synthase subunit HisH, partial [Gammaproteobacteria bacterium]